MRVCLVSNLFPPPVGGDAEVYVSRLAEALAEDHHVVVISTQPGGHQNPRREVADNGVVVYRLAPLNIGGPSNLPRGLIGKAAFRAIDFYHPQVASSVRAIIARERPDIVHVHNWVGLSLAAVLSSVDGGRFDRVPVAITPHDYSLCCAHGDLRHPDGTGCPPGRGCRALSAVNRRLTGSVGMVISPSRYALAAHQQRGFFARAQTAVLPYGLAAATPVAGRTRPKEKQTHDVLFLGEAKRHSGAELLVRAFRALTEPSLRLKLAGYGPLPAEWRRLAEGDPRVSFHADLSRQARQALLDAADCLVVPTSWPENCPLSILEAFQSGAVVIASRIGGIPETVSDGINGLLVEPGDEAAIGAAIERLRLNPQLHTRLRAEAHETAPLFDMAFHASHVAEAYRRLLSAGRTSPLTGQAA